MEGEEEDEDSFTLDQFSGQDTELALYFPEITESYIKSVVVRNRRGSSFSTVSDTRASLHYYTMYGVPFDAVRTGYSNIHQKKPNLSMYLLCT